MTLGVDQRSKAVTEMAKEWDIIDALMGGTRTMREAGQKLLPRWPNEEEEGYRTRLSVATLFPAFERTVSVMAGKPFAKPLTLSKDTPEQIVEWAQDIDREGVALHTFAAEMFLRTIAWGFQGILVEAPRAPQPEANRPPTVKEQREAGMRPYWVRIRHDQIVGWRTEKKVGGVERLSQLRIKECRTEPDGDFGEKEIPRVRVLTPGAFSIWESSDSSTWQMVDSGTTGLDFIPFVPLYGRRRGFMRGKSPLINLAYQNVKHWQSQSDQDTILHVARVPILFARCLGENTTLTVGGAHAITANDEKAELKFVEHTGESIRAGKESLDDLEQQMIQTGAELLVAKPGQRTATESSNDAEANKSDLQRSAEDFEDGLDLALYYTAQYASLERGGNATLYKDYAAGSLSDASAMLVLNLQQTGLLTKKTTLREQQRRGIISADVDPETEIADAAAEGPAPGDLTDLDDQE